jgi:outer membrane protein TolC
MMRLPLFSRWHECAAMTAIVSLAAVSAFAQVGRGGASPGAAPLLVPLSGRTAPGGSVVTTETPIPGATASVDTINPVVQVQGAFAGSIRNGMQTGALSLQEAIRRGLEYNLGALNLGQVVDQARGQRAVARSALLPNLVSDVTASRQVVNLAALGVGSGAIVPGFSFPTVVPPFNIIDARVRLSQSLLDLTARNNYRASSETLRANELSAEDAHNIVVLAVGGAYLQTVAARARVAAGRAQLETANALYNQTEQRRNVGLVAQVDVGRSQVQALTQQQRLTSLQNDFAKKKIDLARMIGLPPTDQYEIGEDIAFAAAPVLPLDDALRQAQETRADLKAAAAQVRAAERALAAAHAERLPSISLDADYGAIGDTLPDARGTYTIAARVRVPIWQGGYAQGEIQQADAAVRQRRAELDDLSSQIAGDVRKASLDVEATASQVEVALRNQAVAQQTLDLTRQRYEAGISDNVEVVQAQESTAVAALDYINSVFAHNLAKLSLARAVGVAADRLPDFLKLP